MAKKAVFLDGDGLLEIKVQGHVGTWYAAGERIAHGKTFYILEHNVYGEDAPNVVIDADGYLHMEDVQDWHDVDVYLSGEEEQA